MPKVPESPSEGIFYVVFLPTGWRLMARPFAEGEDVGHTEWWEQSLAMVVAKAWATVLGVKENSLAREVVLAPYAFPRGRVTKVGRSYRIYHGSDLTTAMGVSRQDVEGAFGVSGRCVWCYDEHERCQEEDQAALRILLGVGNNWNAR